MNKPWEKGFTLIELITVITIMGMILGFLLPRFSGFQLFSDRSNQIGKTALLVQSLKKKAVSNNRDYLINIDTEEGILWISQDPPDEEADAVSRERAIRFDGDIHLVDVEFPKRDNPRLYKAAIRFSRFGYSDMAMIHLREGLEDITIKIEPFLYEPDVENRYLSFEECL